MAHRRVLGSLGGTLLLLGLSVGIVLGARSDAGGRADARLRTVALGVSRPDGRDMADLDAFIAAVGGHVPATWTIWSQWGRADFSAFPMAAARGAQARGAVPMIWWEPVDPGHLDDATYSRHANIVSGMHDEYIRSFARDARRFGDIVLLRFAHEMNGGQFPWRVGSFDNTAESFVAAWRHVHAIFREVGADNVRFVWSVAKEACPGGCNPYAAVYPGDDSVDFLGFSSYNWGARKEGWVPMLQGYTRVTSLLAELSDKPILAVETGANAEGGDKGAWIGEGYLDVLANLPRVSAIVYLDADVRSAGHPDWRLGSPPDALASYADIVSMPDFQGRIPDA